jgi:hypothetical protein
VNKEASASFFEKKEAKKLLLTAGLGNIRAKARSKQKFFCFFFFKKRSPFLLSSPCA